MRALVFAWIAGCGAGSRPAIGADAGADAGTCAPCVSDESTLAGVHFDLCGNRCEYSVAEAAAGIAFVYETIVDRGVSGVSQELSLTRCDPMDPSGLDVHLSVGGGDEGYCMCDCGLGMGGTLDVDLAPGTYPNQLDWDGNNWSGPSDYMRPEGAPFPPGSYRFTAHAEGSAPGGPFAIDGVLSFELVP